MESDLIMRERLYELATCYDTRKSFHNKANVRERNNIFTLILQAA